MKRKKVKQMGMFGITGEKLRHIRSYSPFLNRWFMSFEGGRAMKDSFMAEREQEIMETQIEAHTVTKGMKTAEKFANRIIKSIHYLEKEALSQIFQYFHINKSVEHFLSILAKLEEHAVTVQDTETRKKVKAICQVYLTKVVKALKEVLAWEDDDYRFILNVINEAATKKQADFVKNWRVLFKKRSLDSRMAMMLQRREFRVNIKEEYNDINKLKRLSSRLEALDNALGSKKDVRKNVAKFEQLMAEFEKDVFDMYKSAHTVMRRDLILITLVISDIQIMNELGEDWIQKHFVPEVPVRKMQLSMKKLEQKLGEKAHTIALGLNVVRKEIAAREQDAERYLAKAA